MCVKSGDADAQEEVYVFNVERRERVNDIFLFFLFR